jgi:hypothetical protein
LLGVLMRIEDRITFDQVELIRGVIDVDECGAALEQSADVLSENEAGLRDERNHIPNAEWSARNGRMRHVLPAPGDPPISSAF